MLSDVLSKFLDQIASDPPLKNQAAARDARQKLGHEAKTEACKSCEKAGWISVFRNTDGFEELDFVLGKCGGGVVLLANDGLGYQLPAGPFFCSVKDQEEGGHVHGGAKAGHPSKSQTQTPPDAWPRERGV